MPGSPFESLGSAHDLRSIGIPATYVFPTALFVRRSALIRLNWRDGLVRGPATKERIQQLIDELGRRARGPGKVYLVGGSSVVLMELGRDSTVDVDLKLEPEPSGIFEAIAEIKNRLNINIELAAPDQFIPEVPGWRDRSQLITIVQGVEFYHYDFYSQALSKLERGHVRDKRDVEDMMAAGLLDPQELMSLFESIEPKLITRPSIDAESFRHSVVEFCRLQR